MPRPPSTPAPPVEAVREVPPAPAPAPPKPTVEAPRGVAAIGKSVIIKGQVLSREDLYLDGEMEGTVEVPDHRLTIGPHAKLVASIRAREVVVLGAVNGNVEASEKIDLRKDAKLVGDIKTGGIIIEDGAYFKGSIDIVKVGEAAKAAAAVRPVQQPAPAGPSPLVGAVSTEPKY
ncbi:MAG: polymer-forming cytoskeletal protein [Bryobacteraceae bacterium]